MGSSQSLHFLRAFQQGGRSHGEGETVQVAIPSFSQGISTETWELLKEGFWEKVAIPSFSQGISTSLMGMRDTMKYLSQSLHFLRAFQLARRNTMGFRGRIWSQSLHFLRAFQQGRSRNYDSNQPVQVAIPSFSQGISTSREKASGLGIPSRNPFIFLGHFNRFT